MEWPLHGRYLIPGLNDTWNVYQKLKRGLSVKPAEWHAARAALRSEHEEYIASGGVQLTIEDFFPSQVGTKTEKSSYFVECSRDRN